MVRPNSNGRPMSKPKSPNAPEASTAPGGVGRRSTSTRLVVATAVASDEEKLNVTKPTKRKRVAVKSNSKNTAPRRSSRNKKNYSKEEEDNDMNADEDGDENSPPKKKKMIAKRGVKGKKEVAKRKAESGKKSESFDEEDEDLDFDEDFDEYEDEFSDEEKSEASDGDDENEDVDASAHVNFKDKEWFDKVTKVCQVCKISYKTCMDASHCVTRQHRRLRCYLCYNYYRNTDTLFRHFESNHRASNCNNGELHCPFCTPSKSFPFEHISCHVINTHITSRKAGRGKKRGKKDDSAACDKEEEEEEEDDGDDSDEEDDDEEEEEDGGDDSDEEGDDEEEKEDNGDD